VYNRVFERYVSVLAEGYDETLFLWKVLGSDKMKECISHWRNEFDYVVIDSPHAFRSPMPCSYPEKPRE